MSRTIDHPSGSTFSPGEGAAIDSARGTNISNVARQPPRSTDLAPRGGQPDASIRPRSPLPLSAKLHQPPVPPLHGEIRAHRRTLDELLAEARQEEAEQSQRAHGPALNELLAEERRQEEAEQSQRAQLVHSAMPNGSLVMKRLKDRAARHHPTTRAGRWHARLNGPPKPIDGKRKETFEALVRADVVALANTGKMEPWDAAATMRAAVVDETLGQGILAQDRQLLLDVLDQMVMHVDRLYRRRNVRVTSDTLPAFTNTQVLEEPKKLGSGAFNTVFAVKLQNPDGSVFDGVFKPLGTTECGAVAEVTGIPKDDPQTAMRNIATISYAKKLGFDVIADTRLALIDTGRGVLDPDVGLIMERARGKPATRIYASILTRPEVCAEVTKLQLLDHLTGQGDRHANNYFIHISPNGRAKVTGIDNDQCFGKELTDPAGIQWVKGHAFRGTGLPPVVDTKMEGAINALTSRDIRSMLANKLSKAEIHAAISRHQGVKDQIAQLRTDGRVIEPEQWGDPNVQQLLNGQNSYVGRERERALAIQAQRQGNIAGAPNNNW